MKKIILALIAAVVVASPVSAKEHSSGMYKKHHKHHHHKHRPTVEKEACAVEKSSPFVTGPYVGTNFGLGFGIGKQSAKSVTSQGLSLQNAHSARVTLPGVIGSINAGWDYFFKEKWVVGVDIFGAVSSLSGKRRTDPNPCIVCASGNIPNGPVNGNPCTGARPCLDPGRGLAGECVAQTANLCTAPGAVAVNNINPDIKSKTQMNWSIAAGGKFGGVVNDVLLYTTVHWIGSQWEINGSWRNTLATSGTVYRTGRRHFLNGVKFGLGMAYPITDNILLGLQTSYSRYQRFTKKKVVTDTALQPSIVNPITTSFSVKPEVVDAMATASYKFKGR